MTPTSHFKSVTGISDESRGEIFTYPARATEGRGPELINPSSSV